MNSARSAPPGCRLLLLLLLLLLQALRTPLHHLRHRRTLRRRERFVREHRAVLVLDRLFGRPLGEAGVPVDRRRNVARVRVLVAHHLAQPGFRLAQQRQPGLVIAALAVRPAEVVHGPERVRVLVTEGAASRTQALGVQRQAQLRLAPLVVDAGEEVDAGKRRSVHVAEHAPPALQRLAGERHGGVVAEAVLHVCEDVDGGQRALVVAEVAPA